MENIKTEVSSLGLDLHDLNILKSTISILKHCVQLDWKYSKYSESEVVFIDTKSTDGKKFLRERNVGMHEDCILIGVGEGAPGHPMEYRVTKPLHSMALRKVFDDLECDMGNRLEHQLIY